MAQELIPEKVIGSKIPEKEFTVKPEMSMLYAIGIGFNEDQLKREDFKFTYELSEEFTVFPTYSCIIPLGYLAETFTQNPNIPQFNFMTLLHGEEYAQFFRPLVPGKTYKIRGEIHDIEGKEKGTLFAVKSDIVDDEDKICATVVAVTFVRGIKGVKYRSKGFLSKYSIPSKVPNSQPTKSVQYQTQKNQAFIYRIPGNDSNPLHVDPDMSSMGGFEVPILHGLCSYGITARKIYDEMCGGDQSKLLAFNARFTSHVFPGETLVIDLWSQGGKVLASAKTKERGKQVLIGEAIIRGDAKF